MEKEELLKEAYEELNKDEYPFKVTIENDSIIATWKWKDGNYFDIGKVTKELQEFKYTVKLLDNETYIENDSSYSNVENVNFLNQTASSSSEGFSGKQYRKHVEFTFGKDKETGKIGIQKYSFNTDEIHKPIREFLEKNGYKKEKQSVINVQKSSLNDLDKTLLKKLGLIFTIVGIGLLFASAAIFLDSDTSSDDSAILIIVFIFSGLLNFILGLFLIIKSKRKTDN